LLQINFIVIILLFLMGCSQKNDIHYFKNKEKRYSSATMRPYVIYGIKYYPKKTYIGETFRGVASWYGPNFNGKKTSSGEVYNMYGYTAAHKTLPMHTIVEVINVKNNRRIKLRINDRGPFVGDRIIDLSKQVAINLDLFNSGTSEVIVRVVEISLPKKNLNMLKVKVKVKVNLKNKNILFKLLLFIVNIQHYKRKKDTKTIMKNTLLLLKQKWLMVILFIKFVLVSLIQKRKHHDLLIMNLKMLMLSRI